LLAALHARLAQGDGQAFDQLAEYLLPLLKRKLQHAFPAAIHDLICDAVEDAILEYGGRPSRFDPSRGVPLDHLLLCSARRNLQNLLQADSRRRIRERKYAEHVYHTLCRYQFPATFKTHSRAWLLSAATNAMERDTLQRWLDGDSSTVTLAAALGFSDLSVEQKQKAVKQFKNRLVRRLRRKAEREKEGERERRESDRI
jgi:hypothetical protein